MKMTEEQIISLITKDDLVDVNLTMAALTRLFVRELAAISHKINRDELAAMVIIGAGLYQSGAKEFRAGIDEKALFAAMQKRQDKEKGR